MQQGRYRRMIPTLLALWLLLLQPAPSQARGYDLRGHIKPQASLVDLPDDSRLQDLSDDPAALATDITGAQDAAPSLAVPVRRQSFCASKRICAWMVTSSAVVGSSAMMRSGSLSSAIAIATR